MMMNPMFKDPNGKICIYDEMKKNALYHEPIYSYEDKKKVCEEARKYVMRSDTDWGKVQRLVGGMNRTSVQVKTFSF